MKKRQYALYKIKPLRIDINEIKLLWLTKNVNVLLLLGMISSLENKLNV